MTLDPQIADTLRGINERLGDDFEAAVADFERQPIVILDDPEPSRLERLRARFTRRVMLGILFAGVGAIAVVAAGPTIIGWIDVSNGPTALALAEPPEQTQRVVLDGETVYLEGTVPSQDVSDVLESSAVAAVGRDRVINNFEISAAAVYDPERPIQLSVADPVLFTFGRADLDEHYRPLITLAVELMSAEQSSTLSITGHTDDVGPDEANLRLSFSRAEAVAALVVEQGISPDRITVDGRGETEPIETNNTSDGRAANRRVDFSILGLFGS